MTIPHQTGWRSRVAGAVRLVLLAALLAVLAGWLAAADPNAAAPAAAPLARSDTMQIRLTVEGGETTITATLLDNDTARDFFSLLPLTLRLEDYAATEKISYLPRRLATADAPPGSDPFVGDLAYYAPWGNLAIYYRDAGYASGLVPLGAIDSGLDVLSLPGPFTVTVEADTDPR